MQNKEFLVSVIVTAFNQADTISQTLESILSQECNFQFEILIGDDCSMDGTRDICIDYQKKYPDIIRPLFHKTNVGVATNFVLCVKEAKGEYIAVCAADDYWHNLNKLQLQVDYFNSHPDCGFLYTDYDKLHVKKNRITDSFLKTSGKRIYEGTGLMKDVFQGRFPALTLTVMFRKSLFDKYIPWQDYINYQFTLEDWPTWLIFAKYTSVGYLPISTGTYRYGHESISNIKNYDKAENRLLNEQRMYKYLCDRFPEDLGYDEKGYYTYIYNVLLELTFRKGDYGKAREYVKRLKELGSYKGRAMFAGNMFTFYLLVLFKYIKRK